MTDELQTKMNEVCQDLIANNASAIAMELRESPEGKLTVSIPVKLSFIGSRIYFAGSLSYSRKFTDEAEGMIEFNDPNQPKLPMDGVSSVTISGGGTSVTIDAEDAKKIKESCDKILSKDFIEDAEMIQQCIEVIRSEQKASVSLLQRRLRLGYSRASAIMDEIERLGFVGPAKGAEPRDVLIPLN